MRTFESTIRTERNPAALCLGALALLGGAPASVRAAFPSPPLSGFQSIDDQREVPIGLEEEFLFEPEQEVEAAGRAKVRREKSPMIVRVLNREEIRRSGVRSVPELLRRILGIEVARLSVNYGSIAARGNLNYTSDNMLVLVDGTPYFDPFFGSTRWETIPVLIDDIESIEVVRGPAGALYGANASSGVISIKTRSPKEDGNYIHTGLGNRNSGFVEGRYTARLEDGWSLKATAAYEQSDTFRFPAGGLKEGKGLELGRSRLQAEKDLANGGKFDLFMNVIRSRKASLVVPPGIFGKEDLIDGGVGYAREGMRVNLYLGHQVTRFKIVDSDRNRIFQAAVRFERDFFDRGDLVLTGGLESRFIDSHSPASLDRNVRDWQSGAFLRLRWEPFEATSVWVSGRVENDPTGDRLHISPALSLVQELTEGHFLRLDMGRGYRNPGQVHAYADLRFPTPNGVVRILGNPEIRPARNEHIELNYQGEIGDRVRVSMSGFYVSRRKLLSTTILSPGVLTYGNLANVRTRGFEAEGRFLLSPEAQAWIGYGYQQDEGGGQDLTTPHTVKTGLTLFLEQRTSVDISASFLSARRLIPFGVLAGPITDIPSSWMLTGRVAHRFGAQGPELGLGFWNLLDVDRPELPMGGTPEFRFYLDFRMAF